MKGIKTIYVCTSCGYESPKWLGKCPQCGAWNSFVEDAVEKLSPAEEAKTAATEARRSFTVGGSGGSRATRLDEVTSGDCIRSATGLGELDRVLGGGLVRGSVVLLTGEPGIGKSTLLLQICGILGATRRVLYVSGEESGDQIKLRATRLGIRSDGLYLLTETNIDRILSEASRVKPDVMIIDSIQTIYTPYSSSSPGSVSQVRESAMAFIGKAKNDGVSVILVGHVNKEGSIAGPKILEHMVDAVLCFEGEHQQAYRIIRAGKNRYGSTNEIGVFEMTDRGLEEVPNPSEILLAGRPKKVSGNCAACTIEGTRPIIAEIQALVSPTTFPAPRRTGNGVDYNRMCLLLAVLEKRLGFRFSANDVYLNVIGGLRLDEPAADLAIVIAAASAALDRAVPDTLAAIGEVGLTGEIRAVSQISQRLAEVRRLGFDRCVIPRSGTREIKAPDGLELLRARNIREAIAVAL